MAAFRVSLSLALILVIVSYTGCVDRRDSRESNAANDKEWQVQEEAKKETKTDQEPAQIVAKSHETKPEIKHQPRVPAQTSTKAHAKSKKKTEMHVAAPVQLQNQAQSSAQTSAVTLTSTKPETPAVKAANTTQWQEEIMTDSRFCSAVEMPGNGLDDGKFSDQDWKKLSAMFTRLRHKLGRWVVKHQKKFGNANAVAMVKKIQSIKLARPPLQDEPDLSWRGIAVLQDDGNGGINLKIGSGFARLMRDKEKRAEFELARAISQTLTPCRLEKAQLGKPWDAYLRCMKIDHASQCATGAYSEAGWAVSSALALEVSKPGCELPAFAKQSEKECREQFLLPLVMMSQLGSKSTD